MGSGIPIHLDPYRYTVPRQPVSVHSVLPPCTASPMGWCGAGLPQFPTACWWLIHPAAINGVSVAARWNNPGGCGGPSVPLLCNRRCARRLQCPVGNPNIVVCSCLARQLTGSCVVYDRDIFPTVIVVCMLAGKDEYTYVGDYVSLHFSDEVNSAELPSTNQVLWSANFGYFANL